MSDMETFEDMFADLFEDCHEVLVDRQRKYGPNNIPAFGTLGTAVRLNDKMERLKQLAGNGDLTGTGIGQDFADESIDDTLIDIANYANILRAQLRGYWTREKCPPLREELRRSP